MVRVGDKEQDREGNEISHNHTWGELGTKNKIERVTKYPIIIHGESWGQRTR